MLKKWGMILMALNNVLESAIKINTFCNIVYVEHKIPKAI